VQAAGPDLVRQASHVTYSPDVLVYGSIMYACFAVC